jgi:hypothetical protein
LAAQFTASITAAAPLSVVMAETWNDAHDELADRYPATPAAVSCGMENPAGTVMLTVPGTAKFVHSCLRLDQDGRALVIDPGVWPEPEALARADAVLVTHEHFGHPPRRGQERQKEGSTANHAEPTRLNGKLS